MEKQLRGYIKKGKLGRYYKKTKTYLQFKKLSKLAKTGSSRKVLAYAFELLESHRAFGYHWKAHYTRTIIKAIFKEEQNAKKI